MRSNPDHVNTRISHSDSKAQYEGDSRHHMFCRILVCIPYTMYHILYTIYCMSYTIFLYTTYNIYHLPATPYHILYTNIHHTPSTLYHILYCTQYIYIYIYHLLSTLYQILYIYIHHPYVWAVFCWLFGTWKQRCAASAGSGLLELPESSLIRGSEL